MLIRFSEYRATISSSVMSSLTQESNRQMIVSSRFVKGPAFRKNSGLRHPSFFKNLTRFEVGKEVTNARRALARRESGSVELWKSTGEHAVGIDKMPPGLGHI